MRIISMVFLVGFFVWLPLYLLNSLVLPQLDAMKSAYEQADAVAEKTVHEPQSVWYTHNH